MSDLFNQGGAIFSEDKKYRYTLSRFWDKDKPMVTFIGLNPSTASELENDPTIRRVKKFAFDNGYGGMYMLNLFTLVTPYPADLLKCEDPIGDSDWWLKNAASRSEDIVFCWGSFKEAKNRAEKVIEMFPNALCFGVNADGSPKHPLYLSSKTKLIPYEYFDLKKIF